MAPPETWTGIEWHSEGPIEYFASVGDRPARIADVLFWGGQYLAIGSVDGSDGVEAAFFAAHDGVNWALADSEPTDGRLPVHLAGSTDEMLAASPFGSTGGRLWRSEDGLQWASIASPSWRDLSSDGTLRDMAGGLSGFVAVGVRLEGPDAQAIVAHSADGRSWHLNDQQQLFGKAELQDVVSHAGGFVIAGTIPDSTSDGGVATAVWISRDGIDWTRADVEAPSLSIPDVQVFVGRDGLVLMSAEQRDREIPERDVTTWSSRDGTTWRRDPPPEWQQFAKVFASDGARIVILGLDDGAGAVGWVSTDGGTWIPLYVSATPEVLLDTGPPLHESMAIAPAGLVVWEHSARDEYFQGAWAVGE